MVLGKKCGQVRHSSIDGSSQIYRQSAVPNSLPFKVISRRAVHGKGAAARPKVRTTCEVALFLLFVVVCVGALRGEPDCARAQRCSLARILLSSLRTAGLRGGAGRSTSKSCFRDKQTEEPAGMETVAFGFYTLLGVSRNATNMVLLLALACHCNCG
jgi:hypothetical protein